MNTEFKEYFDNRIIQDNWQCFSTIDKDGTEYEIYVKDKSVVAAYYGTDEHCSISSYQIPSGEIPGVFSKVVMGIFNNNKEVFNKLYDSVYMQWQVRIRAACLQ